MCFKIGVVLEGKERSKKFLGHEDMVRRQLNIFIFQRLSLVHDYYLIYMQQDDIAKAALNSWRNLPRRTRGARPQQIQPLDLWMRAYIQGAKDNGDDIAEELFDISFGVQEEYISYRSIYAYGRHFRREDVDINCLTNDCTIGARFEVGNGVTKDFIGIIEDIMEVHLGSMRQNVLKIRWFDNNTKLNPNYFNSIDTSKVTDCNLITSQRFIYVDDVEQIFFVDVESDTNWKYVLQSHARKYMIFDNMDVPILDDGRHITGLLAGENTPYESVEEEDIDEDNDDAQDTSDSSDGEADYADTTILATANTELESESDSERNNQRLRYILYSCI